MCHIQSPAALLGSLKRDDSGRSVEGGRAGVALGGDSAALGGDNVGGRNVVGSGNVAVGTEGSGDVEVEAASTPGDGEAGVRGAAGRQGDGRKAVGSLEPGLASVGDSLGRRGQGLEGVAAVDAVGDAAGGEVGDVVGVSLLLLESSAGDGGGGNDGGGGELHFCGLRLIVQVKVGSRDVFGWFEESVVRVDCWIVCWTVVMMN